MINVELVNSCEGFWRCITPDGILNASVVLLTIVGAVLVSYVTTRTQIKSQTEATKEEGKKVFKVVQDSFIKATGTIGLFLNSQAKSHRDLVIFIKELEYHTEVIKDSDIINVSPSAIYNDLKSFNDKARFSQLILENILLMLENGYHIKIEEYLLDDSQKINHQKVKELSEIATEKVKEMKCLYEKIEKYYK
ncbi:hypothetical protein [Sporosarcina highlanderae]|uniref:Uncharacterized protein n=1 Tax=Sporosarcina highlanderae TaxID=3035916 RepID=A0ABT8JSX0_9BACL|nr:hypothetical protein [Sporosarcina highlanderae]MDN4608205.1 hypothetical protein [Sporosarcina highlanderae]